MRRQSTDSPWGRACRHKVDWVGYDCRVPAREGQRRPAGGRDVKRAETGKTELATARKMDLIAAKARHRWVKLLHKIAMIQVSNGEGLGKGDSRGNGRRNVTQNEIAGAWSQGALASALCVFGLAVAEPVGLLGQMFTNQTEKHSFLLLLLFTSLYQSITDK